MQLWKAFINSREFLDWLDKDVQRVDLMQTVIVYMVQRFARTKPGQGVSVKCGIGRRKELRLLLETTPDGIGRANKQALFIKFTPEHTQSLIFNYPYRMKVVEDLRLAVGGMFRGELDAPTITGVEISHVVEHNEEEE